MKCCTFSIGICWCKCHMQLLRIAEVSRDVKKCTQTRVAAWDKYCRQEATYNFNHFKQQCFYEKCVGCILSAILLLLLVSVPLHQLSWETQAISTKPSLRSYHHCGHTICHRHGDGNVIMDEVGVALSMGACSVITKCFFFSRPSNQMCWKHLAWLYRV